jgi:hypothetical protein
MGERSSICARVAHDDRNLIPSALQRLDDLSLEALANLARELRLGQANGLSFFTDHQPQLSLTGAM